MTIVSFGLSPSRVKVGSVVTANWAIRNDTGENTNFRIKLMQGNNVLHIEHVGYIRNGETRGGSFAFNAPEEPGTYTIVAVSEYERMGRITSTWIEDDRKSARLVVVRPSDKGNGGDGGGIMAKCTKEDFRNSMINVYKDRAVFWIDSYTPVIDVTSRVKNVKPFVLKAYLIIQGGDTSKIEVLGPYDTLPSKYPDGKPINDANIVKNWEYGEEWERQRCSRDNKWYWVKYPCILIEIPPDISTVFKSTAGRFSHKLKTKLKTKARSLSRINLRKGKMY